jgi:hypothetical protein
MRSDRDTFRRAVIASALLHVALAVGVVLIVRTKPAPVHVPSLIDTAPENRSPAEVPPPQGRPPLANFPARTLPVEAIAVIARAAAAPRTASAPPGEPTVTTPAVPALHGALRPGQSIVYVLDTSGSMGEHGKLTRSRAALIATLRAQPPGVRFQVVAYSSAARSLFPGTSSVLATAANIDAAALRLAALEANGRSHHAEGIRAAASHHPDAIFLLTDSDGIRGRELQSALAPSGKRTYISLSRVTASSIEPPSELR